MESLERSRLRRRELLKLSPLAVLGAFGLPGVQQKVLRAGLHITESVLKASRSESRLAPTFSTSDLTPLERFPVNAYLTDDPGVDASEWRLRVEGAVQSPGEYSLAQIRSLPMVTQITRHICIEGWAVIGSFGGIRLRDLLKTVGAAPDARFVELECADDYYESIDITSAIHPQTLLCHEMYGRPLTPAHGAPLRLQMPTKLGYKQAKHLVTLRVGRALGARRGYWVDQGYPWFGGI